MAYILVADDDASCLKLLEMELRQEGHDVGLASDGEEALRKVSEHRPDLVILDVMMPNKDGFATCKAIRQLDGCAELPVIALTSLDDTFGVHEAHQAGFSSLLWKPWQVRVLQAKVRAFLEVSGAAD